MLVSTFYCFSLCIMCFVAFRAVFLLGEEVQVWNTYFGGQHTFWTGFWCLSQHDNSHTGLSEPHHVRGVPYS